MSSRIVGRRLVVDGGPLVGAAVVRELTSSVATRETAHAQQRADWDALQAKIAAALPTTADVEPIAAAMTGDRLPMTPTERAAWLTAGGTAQVLTADVENDGDRGPRPSRDPMAAIDQAADAARAKAVQRLMAAVAALSVDEVAALAWVAWQLPGRKLRRKCEEATATGWCRTEDPRPTARSTPEDRARAALLAAWRQVVALVHGAQSTAARDVAQRDRGDVLADEAARRAGGGE